ncbi:hypothetical protein SPURM210S_00648 [Streptomyces purpurascens]
MIEQRAYAVEPWTVRETELDLDVLAQSESVFALSNGHVGWRGNLDEGEPHGLPGSYLNGVHELHPLPYAEAGYGYPESGQTSINVTNGKVLRLLVDDEPFDLRYGRLVTHERTLDLRRGVLERVCEWTSPAGSTVRVRSTRLVSLTQRAIAAVAYEVEPVDSRTRVVVQSELVANESLPEPDGDPRAAKALKSPLEPEEDLASGSRLRLVHRTRRSGLRVAVAADHVVTGPDRTTTSSESNVDVARLTVTSVLEPGERLRVEKLVAHGWSGVRSRPAMSDQVEAALAAAAHSGWWGAAEGPAGLPRRLLGPRRRRDRRRRGDPAGRPLRPLPRPSGRRPCRTARHPRQGTHRLGLRRPRLLGHRGVRPAPADLHRAASRRRGTALAPRHAARRPGTRGPTRPAGRRVPLAHHRGLGRLRVLAGRHGRLPRGRRHR